MEKGTHLLLDWYGCDPEISWNATNLEHCLLEAAEAAGCTVLLSYSYPFEPQGCSAFVLLAESHFAAHVSPEYDYVSIDLYTCMSSMMPQMALEYLRAVLKPKRDKVRKVKRY